MTAPSPSVESTPPTIPAAESVRSGLDAVETALARLDAGTYGVCEGCGRPISPEALASDPTVQTHSGCAQPARPLPGLA